MTTSHFNISLLFYSFSRLILPSDMKLVPALLCVLVLASVRAANAVCIPELVQPCWCGYTTVFCENFTDAMSLNDVMVNSVDHAFFELQVRDSSIMHLLAEWLDTKKFHVIEVYGSSLVSLFDQVPSTNNQVTHIKLETVKLLRGIQWEQFKNLEKLREIVMRNVLIKKIGKSFPDNISPALYRFELKDTQTRSLHETAFQNMVNLTFLKIVNTRVATLKRSMFPNPSILKSFWLSNNRIETLPDDMFSDMEKLRYVVMDGNRLTTLPAAVFQNIYENIISYIITFDMENNPLICDCRIAWIVKSKAETEPKGTCTSPSNLVGTNLTSLREEEFIYCG